jgi:hypothetical protein
MRPIRWRRQLQCHYPTRDPFWLEQHEVRYRIGDLCIVTPIGEVSRAPERRPALSRPRVFNLDLEWLGGASRRLAPDMSASCNITAFDQRTASDELLCWFRTVDLDEAGFYCFSHAEKMEARMAARMIVELPSGNKVLFGGRGGSAGLSEVALRDDVARATGDQFKKALGSLADITAAVEQSIGRMAHRPEKVEMEFSASLTAECDLWIVSGEGEAEFKVTLAWGKGE